MVTTHANYSMWSRFLFVRVDDITSDAVHEMP